GGGSRGGGGGGRRRPRSGRAGRGGGGCRGGGRGPRSRGGGRGGGGCRGGGRGPRGRGGGRRQRDGRGRRGSCRRSVVGREDRLQSWRAFERLIRTLRTPGVGVVEHGIGNHRRPGRHDLLCLARGRQRVFAAAVVRPTATPERLIDRYDATQRNARRLGGGDGYGNHVVITAIGFGSAGIRVDSVQINVGIAGIVGVGIRRRYGRIEIHHDNERLRAGHIGVDPV